MSRAFELQHTMMSPAERVMDGNVLLFHELENRQELEETARFLLANRETLDELPIENEDLHNATAGLFEKITASGHLSHIEFPGDQELIHIATLKRLLNAYNESNPSWEVRRNFEEICEELSVYKSYLRVVSGELPKDTIILTSSDAPDEEVTDSEKVTQGYRMLNHKGMLRSYHFEQDGYGGWMRVLEQVSRSNSHDKSTQRWFNDNASTVPLNATGGLSMQAIVSKQRMPGGVVSWVEELDGTFGTERFCGELVAGETERDYGSLRDSSAEKEETMQKFSHMIAKKDEQLKALQQTGVISYQERLHFFYKEIDEKIIPRLLLNAPQYARDTYGVTAGITVEQASMHFHNGNRQLAMRMLGEGFMQRDRSASTGCGGSGSKRADSLSPNDLSGLMSDAIDGALEDYEDWSWSKGMCRIESCATRPGKTEVGPCSICKNCQYVFDHGGDPSKIDGASTEKVRETFSEMIANLLVKNEIVKEKVKT